MQNSTYLADLSLDGINWTEVIRPDILGLIVAGLIWGITNPFLEKGSKESQQEDFDLSLGSLLRTILNYKFIIPFAINQAGSSVYYYFLGKSAFSVGPLIANSVTFASSYFVEKHLKDREFTKEACLGLIIIFVGIYLCATSV
mmetsp:Transcript_27191/g.31351  ORF Transcript_27191/g.31351 Transcript_27191/m.31351 type:complete len:143 (-) Transcript_27191:68-496(-)